jgi:hypothetical protein
MILPHDNFFRREGVDFLVKSSQIKFFVVDLTKQGIANELLEAGVLPEDIVLGFHPPQKRPLTEFVVA